MLNKFLYLDINDKTVNMVTMINKSVDYFLNMLFIKDSCNLKSLLYKINTVIVNHKCIFIYM